MIVEEPVRGSFAYLEQPWLFAMPAVDQLGLFIQRRLPAPPLTHLSGLVVERASKSATTWSMPASPWWQTAAGVFAGGTLAFVADAALAGAVFMKLPTGTMLLSSDLSMNFLEPAGPSSERLVAKGTVIDVGRRQGLSEARVENARGRLLAHATSRCVLQPLPFKPPEPVGVRNSDQVLDLRLRNATAQTCQHLFRRHGREHPGFGSPASGAELPLRACGASRARPECVRLRPHPLSVRGQVPRAGPRAGAIGPSLAGGQLGRRRRSQG